jgi:hypothetical protein
MIGEAVIVGASGVVGASGNAVTKSSMLGAVVIVGCAGNDGAVGKLDVTSGRLGAAVSVGCVGSTGASGKFGVISDKVGGSTIVGVAGSTGVVGITADKSGMAMSVSSGFVKLKERSDTSTLKSSAARESIALETAPSMASILSIAATEMLSALPVKFVRALLTSLIP